MTKKKKKHKIILRDGTYKLTDIHYEHLSPVAKIAARQEFFCQYCGLEWTHVVITKGSFALKAASLEHNSIATIDHILPRGSGGLNNAANRCAACFECNNLKTNTFLSTQREFAYYSAYEVLDNIVMRSQNPDEFQTERMRKNFARLSFLIDKYKLTISAPQEVFDMLERISR